MDGRDRFYMHNQSARAIWVAQGEGLDPSAITDQVVELFSVSHKIALSDVIAQLEAWRDLGLLDSKCLDLDEDARLFGLTYASGQGEHKAEGADPSGAVVEGKETVAEYAYQIDPS